MRAFIAGLLAGLFLSISGCSPRSAAPAGPATSFPAASYENLPAASRDTLRQAWEAAAHKPNDAATVAQFGMILLAYDQPRAAVAPLQRASQLQQDNFAWFYYLGQAQARAGHPAAALDAFKTALPKKPNFVPLQIKIAEAFLAAGRLTEAEHACMAILLAHPDATAAHRTLAGVYEKSGNTAGAAQEKSLAEGDSGNPSYLQDPWMEALREWKLPELKSPASATRQIHFEKARELLAKKRYPQAIAELKLTLVPEDRETPGYLLTLSIAYQQAGDSTNALESAQKAQQLATDQGQTELLPAIEAQLARMAAEESAHPANETNEKNKSATDRPR